MTGVFRVIPVLIKWGGHIVTAVMAVEAILGSAASGDEKRAAVFAYLAEIAVKHKLAWGPVVLEAIDGIITAVVWFLHAFGIIKRKSDKEPAELAVEETVAATRVPVRVRDVELEEFLARTAR